MMLSAAGEGVPAPAFGHSLMAGKVQKNNVAKMFERLRENGGLQNAPAAARRRGTFLHVSRFSLIERRRENAPAPAPD